MMETTETGVSDDKPLSQGTIY